MLDSTTQERMTVSVDGIAGPYIMVPLDQLEVVESMLRDSNVPFWVDSNAISLDGKPAIAIVNLGRGTSAAQIQKLLDAA